MKKRRVSPIVICLLFFVVLIVPVQNASAWAVINVPGDFPTIREGIDAAFEGDTVLVAAGTYTGPNNKNLTFNGKNIVLLSAAGPGLTTIDCQGIGRGFYFHKGETSAAIVDGFTITNGGAKQGGGIVVSEGTSVTFVNCAVVGNSANKQGGGVFVSDSAFPTFKDCSISGNTAQGGGGVRVGDRSAAAFIDCMISENSANTGGGVIAVDDSASTFTNCTISGNEAIDGGGLLVTNSSGPLLDGCTVSGNLATNGGGLSVTADAIPSITRCTFVANRALSNGGGLYVGATIPAPVTQTIVWSNCAADTGDQVYTAFGDSVSFACGDVDTTGVLGLGTVLYDANTISENPLFCDEYFCTSAPTTLGDYTLDDDSPALAAFSPCGQLIGSQPEGCTGRSFDVVEGGRYIKIQDAIDQSVGGIGDTVLVADSTWTGPRNTSLDFGGRNILLKSVGSLTKSGVGTAVIDGGDSVRAVIFQSGENNTAVIEGFTLTRGAAALPGSALLIKGESSPVIRDCVVKGSSGDAGVVRVESGSPTFQSCTIEEDTTSTMDGIMAFVGGNPTVESCVVRNNSGPAALMVATPTQINATQITDNDGCGVYFDSAPSSVVASEISRNADRGVVLNASPATFEGVVFRENGDGGVIVTGLGPSGPSAQSNGYRSAAQTGQGNEFIDCEFSGHSTDRGAGFFFDCTNEPEGPYTVTFINRRFTGNAATFEGGGVAICGRANNGDIMPQFFNCTISANNALDGGGIYMGVTEVGIGRLARAEFDRTILWGNCSTVSPQGEAFVLADNEVTIGCSHTVVEEIAGTGVIDTTQVTTGIPAFCDFPAFYYASDCPADSTIEGLFTLSPSSPAAPQNHPCGPDQIGAFPVEACVPTAIGDTPAIVVPTAIRPPAPNPFNPVTMAEFTLDRQTHVTVRVYDVKGRLTRTLIDRPMSLGVHRVEWDGQDRKGNPAASGVYFLRFTAGTTDQTHKMVLLK